MSRGAAKEPVGGPTTESPRQGHNTRSWWARCCGYPAICGEIARWRQRLPTDDPVRSSETRRFSRNPLDRVPSRGRALGGICALKPGAYLHRDRPAPTGRQQDVPAAKFRRLPQTPCGLHPPLRPLLKCPRLPAVDQHRRSPRQSIIENLVTGRVGWVRASGSRCATAATWLVLLAQPTAA